MRCFRGLTSPIDGVHSDHASLIGMLRNRLSPRGVRPEDALQRLRRGSTLSGSSSGEPEATTGPSDASSDASSTTAGAAPEDPGSTTAALTTSGGPAETTSLATTSSETSEATATGWETGGLGCIGDPISHLVDARVIAVADLPELPPWGEPDGHVLILSSTPAICDAPLSGPTCGEGHEYRLHVALPPGLEPGFHYFGAGNSEPQEAPDLKSWIVLSHTGECSEGGQIPEGNYSKGVQLQIDSFDPVARTIAGRLCGAYQPGLGDLAGEFTAQGCP